MSRAGDERPVLTSEIHKHKGASAREVLGIMEKRRQEINLSEAVVIPKKSKDAY